MNYGKYSPCLPTLLRGFTPSPKNKAKDYEKHVTIFEDKVKKALTPTEKSEELTFETSEINDSQLEMLSIYVTLLFL